MSDNSEEPIIVTTGGEDDDQTNEIVSLREALAMADAADVVGFAEDVDLVRLTDGEIAIAENVTIDGGGTVTITADASNNDITRDDGTTDVVASYNADGAYALDDNTRIFNIAADEATLAGLTLTGGGTGDVYADGGAVSASGDLVLDGAVVTGNHTRGDSAEGGALHVDGSVTVRDSEIAHNATWGADSFGGAIKVLGDITVEHSDVTGNRTFGSAADGGAIDASSTVTVTDSTFSDNRTEGSYADGGAIWGYDDVTVTNSTFSGNRTEGDYADGGAIDAYAGNVTVTNSTFSGNRTEGSDAEGGSISVYEDVTVTNSTFSGNRTEGDESDGGAIDATSTAKVTNSTFSDNRSEGSHAEGGAIWGYDGVTVTNSTFSSNRTEGGQADGGAIWGYDDVTVTNSTFSGNRTEGDQARGGAVSAGGVAVSDSIFRDNEAEQMGGAVHTLLGSQTPTFKDSVFENNTAVWRGGALAIYGEDATIDGSAFTGNTVQAPGGEGFNADEALGGAIYAVDTVRVENSDLVGNTANEGGAIHADTLALGNSVVTGNVAGTGDGSGKGGGLWVGDNTSKIDGSIIAGNEARGDDAEGNEIYRDGDPSGLLFEDLNVLGTDEGALSDGMDGAPNTDNGEIRSGEAKDIFRNTQPLTDGAGEETGVSAGVYEPGQDGGPGTVPRAEPPVPVEGQSIIMPALAWTDEDFGPVSFEEPAVTPNAVRVTDGDGARDPRFDIAPDGTITLKEAATASGLYELDRFLGETVTIHVTTETVAGDSSDRVAVDIVVPSGVTVEDATYNESDTENGALEINVADFLDGPDELAEDWEVTEVTYVSTVYNAADWEPGTRPAVNEGVVTLDGDYGGLRDGERVQHDFKVTIADDGDTVTRYFSVAVDGETDDPDGLEVTTTDDVEEDDDELSLREAINRANENDYADQGPDTITFADDVVAEGLIRIAEGNEAFAITDDLVIEGGGIVITGDREDDDSHATDAEGNPRGELTLITESRQDGTLDDNVRIFEVPYQYPTPPSVTLENMTLTGGVAPDAQNGNPDGGAIHSSNNGGTLTLDNVTAVGNAALEPGGWGGVAYWIGETVVDGGHFEQNTAAELGGAIYAYDLDDDAGTTGLEVSGGAVFRDNSGTDGSTSGGAVYASTARIAEATFEDNSASMGGAVYLYSTLDEPEGSTRIVENTVFKGNEADTTGGAIYADGVTVQDSAFSGNEADGYGGAIGISGSGPQSVIDQSSFDENSAGWRGGAVLIWSPDETAQITDSSFSGNSVTGDWERTPGSAVGGAIYAGDSVDLDGVTVHGNRAILGGGVWANELDLANSVFTANVAEGEADNPAQGGGIFVFLEGGRIENTVVAGNAAQGVNAEGNEIYWADGAGPLEFAGATVVGYTEEALADGVPLDDVDGADTVRHGDPVDIFDETEQADDVTVGVYEPGEEGEPGSVPLAIPPMPKADQSFEMDAQASAGATIGTVSFPDTDVTPDAVHVENADGDADPRFAISPDGTITLTDKGVAQDALDRLSGETVTVSVVTETLPGDFSEPVHVQITVPSGLLIEDVTIPEEETEDGPFKVDLADVIDGPVDLEDGWTVTDINPTSSPEGIEAPTFQAEPEATVTLGGNYAALEVGESAEHTFDLTIEGPDGATTTGAFTVTVKGQTDDPAGLKVTTAEDVVVKGDGELSLREAIIRANENDYADDGPDTITFADAVLAEGLIRIAEGNEAFAITDDLVIEGGGIVITGDREDDDSHATDDSGETRDEFTLVAESLDAGALDDNVRIFEASDDTRLTLRDMTLTGGRHESDDDDGPFEYRGEGGAVLAHDIVLENVDAIGNSAVGNWDDQYAGGGNYLDETSGTGGRGGAVYATGDVTVTGGRFSGNVSTSDGGAIATGTMPGGVFDDVRVSIENARFSDNVSEEGSGGAIATNESITLKKTDFIGNEVGEDVGGGAVSAGGTITVEEGTFDGNKASWGGALSGGGRASNADEPVISVSDAVFLSNVAKGQYGGAIYTFHSAELTRTHFSDNAAYLGGGAVEAGNIDVSGGGFHDNIVDGVEVVGGGALRARDSVNVTNDAAFTGNRADSGSGGAINAGTVIVESGHFGGNSAQRHGGAVSAEKMVEIGTPAASMATEYDVTMTDNEAGAGDFPAEQAYGGAVYSFGEVDIWDTRLQDNSASASPSEDPGIALGGAVMGFDDVTIVRSELGGNTVTSGINENGLGAEGGAAFSYNELRVEDSGIRGNDADNRGGGLSAGSDGGVVVSNSVVEANEALSPFDGIGGPSSDTFANSGGGVYSGGDVVIDNGSRIVGNSAGMDEGGNGGGVFGQTVEVSDSAIVGNTVGARNDLFASGGGVAGSSVVVENSLIHENRVDDLLGVGGGVYAFDGAYVVSSGVVDNHGPISGGIEADEAVIVNTLVAQNVSDSDDPDQAGGIRSSDLALVSSTVADNESRSGDAGKGTGAGGVTLLPGDDDGEADLTMWNSIVAGNSSASLRDGGNPQIDSGATVEVTPDGTSIVEGADDIDFLVGASQERIVDATADDVLVDEVVVDDDEGQAFLPLVDDRNNPAIDAADETGLSETDTGLDFDGDGERDRTLTTDGRGEIRSVDIVGLGEEGEPLDAGAFELQSTQYDYSFIAEDDFIDGGAPGTEATGNVFVNNGNGEDQGIEDFDVVWMNDSGAAVGEAGEPVTRALGSGAILEINADGTFTYDPNGVFAGLRAGEQGTDVFRYAIAEDNPVAQALVSVAYTGPAEGEEDPEPVSGVTHGIVHEDGSTPVDEGGDGDPTTSSSFQGRLVLAPGVTVEAASDLDGKFGTFKLFQSALDLRSPVWTYTVDDDNPHVQRLEPGEHLRDELTLETDDGETAEITVDILGTADGDGVVRDVVQVSTGTIRAEERAEPDASESFRLFWTGEETGPVEIDGAGGDDELVIFNVSGESKYEMSEKDGVKVVSLGDQEVARLENVENVDMDTPTDASSGEDMAIRVSGANPSPVYDRSQGTVSLDTNGDGDHDASMNVGADRDGDFVAVRQGSGDYEVKFEPYIPDLAEEESVDGRQVNGISNPSFLNGYNTSSFEVELEDSATAAENVLGAYEVTSDDRIADVRILSKNAKEDEGETWTPPETSCRRPAW